MGHHLPLSIFAFFRPSAAHHPSDGWSPHPESRHLPGAAWESHLLSLSHCRGESEIGSWAREIRKDIAEEESAGGIKAKCKEGC